MYSKDELNQLVGEQFGQLLVLRFGGRKNGAITYDCLCSCGKEINARKTNLTRGRQTDCGCQAFVRRRASGENLVGERFCNLVVLELEAAGKHGHVMKCACDCGKIVRVRKWNLLKGTTKSCGCRRVAVARSSKLRKLSPREAVRNDFLKNYRHDAKRRSLSWELTADVFGDLIYSPCEYCGLEASMVRRVRGYTLMCNGVDRVDNLKGYSKENCVSCCFYCNKAKWTSSKEDFIAHAQRVVDWQTVKNGISVGMAR